MATATLKQAALLTSGLAAVASALAAAVLIWMILTSPDQAAMATADGSLVDVLALAFRRLASVALRLAHWL
jgi:hypothetical protein